MRSRRTAWNRRASLLLAGLLAAALVPLPSAAEAAPLALPTTELTSPAIVSPAPRRLDVFTRSASGRLLHQQRPAGGSWSRVVDRGGTLASQPAAASWGGGRVDVLARGTDNALWHRTLVGTRWGDWTRLGGRLTSAPAVISRGTGRLDVVIRGTDNAIWHRTYAAGTGWSAWRSLGGRFTSSPSLASWGPGRLDVMARGTDNTIWHRSYRDSSGWSAWRSLGGRSTSQPAAVAPARGYLDIAMRRADGTVWTRSWSPAGWGAWVNRGGAFTSGPGAHTVDGRVELVARRSNGGLSVAARPAVTSPWGPWRTVDAVLPFRRLGTWIKVWDYPTVNPSTAVADMRARGVRTLYLQTARFTSTSDFHDRAKAGEWLDAAHRAGIRVVGWYVPGYGDMGRDVRRTVAIGDYVSPGGQRFDAVGVDIEYYGSTGEVSRSVFYQRIGPHLDQVRQRTPAVIGAIVPPPFATKPGTYWDGFPWPVIGPRSEVVIPMVMWSNRTGYTPAQVYTWVRTEVEQTRQLTGRPVMAEGGVGSPSTADVLQRIDAYVRGVRDARGIGGAHWDYVTTRTTFWPILGRLNEL